MAIMHLTRYSQKLQTQTNSSVILPDDFTNYPLPAIWLFHGLGDNGTVWARKTTIESLADTYKVAIIMPNMGRSFYMNEQHGMPYWDYLTTEFIPGMQQLLPITTDPNKNFVIGNSMGGFGAMKLGLSHPEWFRAVAMLSPVVDLNDIVPIMPNYDHVFGPQVPVNYLQSLMDKSDHAAFQQLSWYRVIGQDDFMKQSNDAFTDVIQANGINETYLVHPGTHNWDFWNQEIQTIFAWINTLK